MPTVTVTELKTTYPALYALHKAEILRIASLGNGTYRFVDTGTTYDVTITKADADESSIAAQFLSLLTHLPISGLVPSNATDTDHDITVSIGRCADSSGSKTLTLPSAMTKQIDATWAAGTNQGGLFSGTVAADTTYHAHLIEKDSDGSIDWGWDTSVTAANIPTGYTAYRCIGSNRTNGSSNFLPFTAVEIGGGAIRITPDDRITVVNTTTPGTSGNLVDAGVPTGRQFLGVFASTLIESTSITSVNITETSATDADPATVTLRDLSTSSSSTRMTTNVERMTDTSGQIRYRSTVSPVTTLTISLVSYTDFRR